MPFYPDEGLGEEIEIENKYDLSSVGEREDSEDDSDIVMMKSNKPKEKLEPVSGLDKEELKQKIENFSLNNKQEDSFLENSIDGDLEVEKDKILFQKDLSVKKLEKALNSKESVNSYKKTKKVSNETLNWYMKISGWPIFFIVLYSTLILGREYLMTVPSDISDFVQNLDWFDNLKWPFEIFIFLITTYIVVKKEKQLPRIAGITGVIIGFSAGVIIAVIKLFWYREMWNIFYLSAESIFLAVTGLVVSLLVSALFYDEHE